MPTMTISITSAASVSITRTPDGGRIRSKSRSTILFRCSSTIGRQQVPQIAATISPISRTKSIGVFAIALSNPSSSVKTARISSKDRPATAKVLARPVTIPRAVFTLVGPDLGKQLAHLAQELGIPGTLGDPVRGDLLMGRLKAREIGR